MRQSAALWVEALARGSTAMQHQGRPCHPSSHPPSIEQLEWARTVSMQASLKATLARAKAFATSNFQPELAAFKLPPLIEYEGAAHGLFATENARFTSDLLAFIKR